MWTIGYTARHRALLQAVRDGRGQLVGGSLTVDGRWCDNFATIELIQADLVRPADSAPYGVPIPAVLTNSGTALLRILTL
ncbi:hypothetical protein [Kibdelosporangium aridum]|nr:hypothetical protein [Kibdelosporangium aridum]